MKAIDKIALELSQKINSKMDAHLIESIVSLFNSGVLKHYVRTPRTSLDLEKFYMSVDAASGVTFEGREKIIELEKDINRIKELMKDFEQEYYKIPRVYRRKDPYIYTRHSDQVVERLIQGIKGLKYETK